MGVVPAVWILGLVGAGLVAAVASLGLLIASALSPPPALEMWGVIEPSEWLLALHDHSAAGDGTAGCALTGHRLVRFDERETTAAVSLRGAALEVEPRSVVVRKGNAIVRCPFGPDEDVEAFAAEIRRFVGPSPPAPRSP